MLPWTRSFFLIIATLSRTFFELRRTLCTILAHRLSQHCILRRSIRCICYIKFPLCPPPLQGLNSQTRDLRICELERLPTRARRGVRNMPPAFAHQTPGHHNARLRPDSETTHHLPPSQPRARRPAQHARTMGGHDSVRCVSSLLGVPRSIRLTRGPRQVW